MSEIEVDERGGIVVQKNHQGHRNAGDRSVRRSMRHPFSLERRNSGHVVSDHRDHEDRRVEELRIETMTDRRKHAAYK